MSDVAGPRRKHRHDLGHEDHGATALAGPTRTIQVLLGLLIVATFALIVYALVDGAETAGAGAAVPPAAAAR